MPGADQAPSVVRRLHPPSPVPVVHISLSPAVLSRSVRTPHASTCTCTHKLLFHANSSHQIRLYHSTDCRYLLQSAFCPFSSFS